MGFRLMSTIIAIFWQYYYVVRYIDKISRISDFFSLCWSMHFVGCQLLQWKCMCSSTMKSLVRFFVSNNTLITKKCHRRKASLFIMNSEPNVVSLTSTNSRILTKLLNVLRLKCLGFACVQVCRTNYMFSYLIRSLLYLYFW